MFCARHGYFDGEVCLDCLDAVNPIADGKGQAAPSLTWTKERPTMPGWYWNRRQGGDAEIILLTPWLDAVVYECEGEIFHLEYWGGEWAGPIPEPSDAGKEGV